METKKPKQGIKRVTKIFKRNRKGQVAQAAVPPVQDLPSLPSIDVASPGTQDVLTVTRPFIKCRIVTWNMHSMLPTGDLTELLGSIPADMPTVQAGSTIPQLPMDGEHPYHLVVVGGQEVPQGGIFGDWSRSSSWTEMLQDWLCRGQRPATEEEEEIDEKAELMSKRGSKDTTYSKSLRDQEEKEDEGPYVLVSKERLMGIYCAVFVLKSCRHLVQGVDKAKVTAGLLNGRVGNKGCSAISVNFGGYRILFISAHLAAHQAAIAIRKANVDKIKEELEIDTFAEDQTPTAAQHLCSKSTDITDQFNWCFFFGDLNYRLDISRMHADWLLQSKSYSQALGFDQLSLLLKSRNNCFRGFAEAPITFGPTYKFDLLTFKRRKLRTLSIHTNASILTSAQSPQDDTASIASTVASLSAENEKPEGLSPPTPPSPSSMFSSPPDVNETAKIPVALQKAKVKFLTLRSASAANIFDTLQPPKKDVRPGSPQLERRASLIRRPTLRTSLSETLLAPQAENGDVSFDTSSKQRVQSYTDRILYKTTLMDAPSPVRRTSGFLDSLGLGTRKSHSPSGSVASTPRIEKGRAGRIGFDQPEPLERGLFRRQSSGHKPRRNSTIAIDEPLKRIRSETVASNPDRPGLRKHGSDSASPYKPTRASESDSHPDHNGFLDIARTLTRWKLPATKTLPVTLDHHHHHDRSRSWWNFFPAMFTASPMEELDRELQPEPIRLPEKRYIGPVKGQVEPLLYDSVNDLYKMQATSDHRPVKAVFALGMADDTT